MSSTNRGNFRSWPKWKLRATQVRNGRRYGHRWTPEEAKRAGRKGGRRSQQLRRTNAD